MKKVIVIGCPGSGKSTFARELEKISGLPLYHLDMMYWNSDKTTVSREAFIDRLMTVMRESKWIIDGNYASTMEMRFKECDTVFFLDYPTEVCLDGIRERRGKPRPDMPWVETGDVDEEFVSMVRNYSLENRPRVLTLIKEYSDKEIIIFKSRQESEKYLSLQREEK